MAALWQNGVDEAMSEHNPAVWRVYIGAAKYAWLPLQASAANASGEKQATMLSADAACRR